MLAQSNRRKMTNPPGLPKYRHRKFKAVIHNIRQDSDTLIDRFISQFPSRIKKAHSSIEEYNHQDGYHVHIYFEFINQVWFAPLLNSLKDLSETIKIEETSSLPPGEVGRVDLDSWAPGQTWESILRYLVNPIKDKKVGILRTHRTKYCWCKCGLKKSNICPIFNIPLISKHIYSDKCKRLEDRINSTGWKRDRPSVELPEWFKIP